MQDGKIVFSMNGFRKNLNSDLKELKEQIMLVLNDESFDKDDLASALDSVIASSNCLNCVWLDGDENFTDMQNLYLPLIDE
ncbi:hypothetical protein OCF84_20875 (plasmid) [Shewanella xiamenensis]|uniref:Uncharacterized protein n=1 Tax=Shewanella xiamenensis TaxID=332186 RepID=A0ABT6UH29_9GAMM|nr:hypothetical protein [Shewanella xiamenensis]MDI5833277.1 hypothetical protein [Shewanella xiamenensis]WHF57973.1 hypothetical protein OCF84_20875 [Shewanella xiamenensis]